MWQETSRHTLLNLSAQTTLRELLLACRIAMSSGLAPKGRLKIRGATAVSRLATRWIDASRHVLGMLPMVFAMPLLVHITNLGVVIIASCAQIHQ